MSPNMPAPTHASLSLLGRCNSRCVYCGSWASPLPGPATDLWLEIVEQLAALGVKHLNLSGGEPLLRDDLPLLIRHASEHDLIVQLSTNGLLLKSVLFQQAVAAGLNYVTVSLDTLNPKTFFQLRGVPLDKVLEGIAVALSLRETYHQLRVGLKCVVSRPNLHDIMPLVTWATAQQLYLGLQPFHPQFVPDHATSATLSFSPQALAELEAVFERLIEIKRDSNVLINHTAYLSHFPQWLVYGVLPDGFTCTTGAETVNIDTQLNVKPCWLFPPIGNLAQQPLAHLWTAPEFIKVRQKMRSCQCSGCWLTCHADLNPPGEV